MKPLPHKIRILNRSILILVGVFLLLQFGQCVFFSENSVATAASASLEEASSQMGLIEEEDDDTLPQRSEFSSRQEIEEKVDLTHVFLQKDTSLAHQMDIMLRRYRPQNAFFLAVDARTNEILAWGERKDSSVQTSPDYLTRATFPAASLAKTITIAAAMESRKYTLDSEIPLIGQAHTLYKFQLRVPDNYKGPTTTLEEAYAKSYNPPMALMGFSVGSARLKSAARKLGFNYSFPENIPQRSLYAPPDSGYGLAETSSGFTQKTTLSPLQAAAMVRAILMKKPLEIPWSANRALGYAPMEPQPIPNTEFSRTTYNGLRQAMIETAIHGTARKNISPRNIARRYLERLDIGGKTGSLDGDNPKGRYDWFMGFAQEKDNPQNAIIIVIMQAHGEIRSQPATQVAGILVNYWAKQNIPVGEKS